MKVRVLVSILGLAIVAGPSALHGQQELGEAYVARLTAIWESDADRGDVESLGALLREDAVYAHPGVGARIEGRQAIVDAMASFLGATRGPQLSDVTFIDGRGVVVVAFNVSMQQRRESEWVDAERRQVVVLEVEEGAIRRIVDYW